MEEVGGNLLQQLSGSDTPLEEVVLLPSAVDQYYDQGATTEVTALGATFGGEGGPEKTPNSCG